MALLLIILTATAPFLADGLRAQGPALAVAIEAGSHVTGVMSQASSPPARGAMSREAAERILQERHALTVSRNSSAYKALLGLTIMGDQGQLRVALAAFELRNFMAGNERELLRRHLSRLLAEKLLGREATRVKDVSAVLAHERAQSASFARLREAAFRKLVEVSLPTQDAPSGVTGLPKVEVEVRQALAGGLEVTGDLRVRIRQAQDGGEPWERDCTLPPSADAAWSSGESGSRSATLQCQGDVQTEQPADFNRALARVRAGQASVEIVPIDVMVLPASLEASLPYEQAVELMSRGSCVSTGNCQQAFIGWLKRFAPTMVVYGFLAAQLVLAAVLFWMSRRAPLAPASRRVKWSLAYLVLVVLAHVAMVATSLQAGALLLLTGWYVLGLPLFVPGFFLGVAALAWAFSDAAFRAPKILLGVLAVTTPVLEWLLMSGILRSGYAGG